MRREDLGGGAGDDRRRERRAGELDVAGGDDARRLLRDERRGGGHRADHVAAGRREVGLREAVERVAVGRPRRRVVVVRRDGAVDVVGADRDHERIVAGRERDAARLAVDAVVARRRDDDDTPLNQSRSTALSSGSNMKLFGWDEWSEKLATRMPYLSLFCEDPVGGAR